MRIVVSWSGGKDAASMLYELEHDPEIEVVELLTTIAEEYDRSSMHGVRRGLYDRQAERLDLPIRYVFVPAEGSNEVYEERMGEALSAYRERGVDAVAFADLHLEDVRAYREEMLSRAPIEGCWPVWGRDTDEFVAGFLDAGFRATVVCVDGSTLDESFVGRELTREFLSDLPDGVDPCGENGEFHTFVHDGPTFEAPVGIERGERVAREVGDGVFHYCDLRERPRRDSP